MGEIIKNYLFIFIVPFLIGIVIRFLCRRIKRTYLVTTFFAILAVIGWVFYYTVPSHGSELYGVVALLVTSAAVGTLLTGVVLRLKTSRD